MLERFNRGNYSREGLTHGRYWRWRLDGRGEGSWRRERVSKGTNRKLRRSGFRVVRGIENHRSHLLSNTSANRN
ncbi:MAG: hypothetical protein EBT98_10815 [Opitutaceae bacterium]|nr:hypothetical protein [Opitutaceae bacterium]